jgi:predicted nicotinamide N-methyase
MTPDDDAMWSLVWESSEALVFLLDALGPLLRGVRCLELGCGAAVASATAHAHGACVVATDAVGEAVERALERGVPARVLRWDDVTFVEPFEMVLGSDLFFAETCVVEVEALLRRVGCRVALFSSPPRRPVLRLAELLRERYACVECERVELPGCEPCVVIVACDDAQAPLYASVAALIAMHRREAQVIISDTAPPPPPLPSA